MSQILAELQSIKRDNELNFGLVGNRLDKQDAKISEVYDSFANKDTDSIDSNERKFSNVSDRRIRKSDTKVDNYSLEQEETPAPKTH